MGNVASALKKCYGRKRNKVNKKSKEKETTLFVRNYECPICLELFAIGETWLACRECMNACHAECWMTWVTHNVRDLSCGGNVPCVVCKTLVRTKPEDVAYLKRKGIIT